MVVALQEKIAAFDACTFKSCFCITSEYMFIKFNLKHFKSGPQCTYEINLHLHGRGGGRVNCFCTLLFF